MREQILERIRRALAGRGPMEHPGGFPGPPGGGGAGVVDEFRTRFVAGGGEVVQLGSYQEARTWLAEFASEFDGAAVGARVPSDLTPALPPEAPERASLGVSMARGAAAFTGSLLLDAAGGRRAQILPPTHLVWVRTETIHRTLEGLLAAARESESSALALHSGPSKSADIGQIMVKGVHGPGRVVAALLGEADP